LAAGVRVNNLVVLDDEVKHAPRPVGMTSGIWT
jgi:hypothetical protein